MIKKIPFTSSTLAACPVALPVTTIPSLRKNSAACEMFTISTSAVMACALKFCISINVQIDSNFVRNAKPELAISFNML